MKKTIKLVSYNIHRCIGVDRSFDPERILAVLHEIDADIIALQEVDSGIHVKHGLCQVDFFTKALPGEHVVGFTIESPDGSYGNLLLTRGKVLQSRQLDLSVGKREPRGALDATVEIYGQKLRLICAHLGLHPRERLSQVRQLLTEIGDASALPTLLMGDFNEWLRIGRPVRYLNRRFGRTHAPKTFPSQRPIFRLDRFWLEPADAIIDVEAHSSELSAVASDHLPIKLTLDLEQLQTTHFNQGHPHANPSLEESELLQPRS